MYSFDGKALFPTVIINYSYFLLMKIVLLLNFVKKKNNNSFRILLINRKKFRNILIYLHKYILIIYLF